MNKITLFLLGALFLTSCSKDSNNLSSPNDNQNKTVSVKIASIATKSIDTPITTGKKTKINDGAILFFTNEGVKVYSHLLNEEPKGVVVIPTVPASATKILFIANYIVSTGGTYSDFDNLSLDGCKDLSVSIANLQSGGNGVDNVIMSGPEAPITEAAGSTTKAPIGEASITITPVVSRIELKSIAAKTGIENEITDFRLLGVFIPNHYATGSISAIGKGELINPVANNFGVKFPYASSATETGYLNDFNASGLSIEASKVFAYHTFPATGADNLPSITIKVDQVKFNDGNVTDKLYDNGNEQFITITSYKKSGVPVSNFESAKIYSISSVNFGIANLTNDPYNKPKSVSVDVTVTEWTVEDITPDL